MSASLLTSFSVQFSRYVPIPIFIFGFIGNLLNIMTFTRPQLIKNPISTYLICSSMANLNSLLFGLVARSLADGFNIDPSLTNLGFCRVRYFILHCSQVLSSWFIILAAIDRYCISSRNIQRRRLSSLKYACYSVAATTLTVSAIYSHVLGLFTIEQLKSGPYCYAQAGAYRIFYDFLYFTTYSFVPPIVMIIVGLGTFYNIHHTRRQIGSTTSVNTNVRQLRKRDRQLIRMLLFQLIFIVLLTLPIAIQKLYATFTQYAIKNSYQLAAESFVAQLMRIFTHINSSISFYIFIVCGKGFRSEFGKILLKIVGCIFGRNNQFYGRIQTFIETPSIAQVATVNRPITVRNQH